MTTVGILGGGQLGRLMGLEAKKLGLRRIVLDPTPNGPAAQICDEHLQADLDDQGAALELARRCDVVTFEWELIAADLLDRLAQEKPVRPGPAVLRAVQDRLVQKEFLKGHGIPQAEFIQVDESSGLESALRRLGGPCILKTRRRGYDGKGQARLNEKADLATEAATLSFPCVLEKRVDFVKEISVVLCRALDGNIVVFPLAENVHRTGLLHTTFAPANIASSAEDSAKQLATTIADAFGHVGVMAVEMFLLGNGDLLVNEIAPRVHNSGHYTLDACATSQFAQHLRAICGLPLGSTDQAFPAVMINVLGDLWDTGEPRWDRILRRSDVRLYLYGKAKPAAGRKMGHIIILGEVEKALADAESLLEALRR